MCRTYRRLLYSQLRLQRCEAGARFAQRRRDGSLRPLPDEKRLRAHLIIPVEQWRRLVDWMGRPPSISGPEFEKIAYRRKNPEIVVGAIAEFCSRHTKEE